MRAVFPFALATLAVAACTAPPPEEPVAPAPAAEAPAAPAPPPVATAEATEKARALPTACAEGAAEICTPPKAFVERLCQSSHPDVALTMFRKSSPWTRAYVNGTREAWYTEARSRPQELRHAEEVIIVTDRGTTDTGVRVSGSGSYDVLRYNGSCVSLMSDEVSLTPRGVPVEAVIPWRKLDPAIRNQLLEDDTIAYRAEKRREDCRGARDSAKCTHADRGLSQLIARYLRVGGDIPPPRRVP